MIVIDPRRTETAELADFHLQVKPGTDAWLLGAMAAILVEEGLVDRALAGRARRRRSSDVATALRDVPIAEWCAISGVDEELVRAPSRRARRGRASVAVFEDLGVQMNRHSTLVSYLEKLRVAAHRQLRQAGRPVRARRRWSSLARAAAAARGDAGHARSSARASSAASCRAT